MKKITFLLIVIAISSLLLTFIGCKEEDSSMSINDRIDSFVSDLNITTRNSLKEHFHSDNTASTSSESYWDTKFDNDSGESYSLGTVTTTGTDTRNVKIIGGIYDVADTFTFTMKEEDTDDWYILDIDLNGSDFVP